MYPEISSRQLDTLGEIANMENLVENIGIDGDDDEKVANTIEAMTADWTVMIDMFSTNIPELMAKEKINVREALEVKEPDFKRGKLGESEHKKQSGAGAHLVGQWTLVVPTRLLMPPLQKKTRSHQCLLERQ